MWQNLLQILGLFRLASFITPKKQMRDLAQTILGKDYVGCYVKASLATCQKRDPKGFYKKAERRQIKNFTGLESSFDFSDEEADLVLDTEEESLDALVDKVVHYLENQGTLRV